MADLLDETGEHKYRYDGVATAGLAEPPVQVRLHVCRVITSRYTEGWTCRVLKGDHQQMIVEALEASRSQSFISFTALYQRAIVDMFFSSLPSARTIRVPDSEAELRRPQNSNRPILRLATDIRIGAGKNNVRARSYFRRKARVDTGLCQFGKCPYIGSSVAALKGIDGVPSIISLR